MANIKDIIKVLAILSYGTLALDGLHPAGKCTCAGEGKCSWCTSLAPCGHTRAECPGCPTPTHARDEKEPGR